jgi:hypothetical protein
MSVQTPDDSIRRGREFQVRLLARPSLLSSHPFPRHHEKDLEHLQAQWVSARRAAQSRFCDYRLNNGDLWRSKSLRGDLERYCLFRYGKLQLVYSADSKLGLMRTRADSPFQHDRDLPYKKPTKL